MLKPVLDAARGAYRGELPERYRGYPGSFRAAFDDAVRPLLCAGQCVLDVGAGRSPTVAPADRPPGCAYWGLDVSRHELDAAPEGSYDRTIVGDITVRQPELEDRFDLVLTFQALEHVDGTDRAFANMYAYLRPGGHLVAQLSGGFAVYAVANRLVPQRLTRRIQQRLYGRDPDTVFPARYDRCYFRALERLTAGHPTEIRPLWMAEPYCHFSPVLRSAYIAYEEWARRGGRLDLAPYYLVVSRR